MATSKRKDRTLEILQALISSDKVKPRLVDINTVKENPNNPQKITDDEFEKLKQSIKEFPEMLAFRPVIIDADGVALAGNKRRRACYALGWSQIPVIDASDLPDKLLKRLIIQDNVQAGTWDKKILRAEWKMPDLSDWGLKVADILKKTKEATEQLQKPESVYFIRVACLNRKDQLKKQKELTSKGYECEMINTQKDGN